MLTGRFPRGRAIGVRCFRSLFISIVLGSYEADVNPRNPFKSLLRSMYEQNCYTLYSECYYGLEYNEIYNCVEQNYSQTSWLEDLSCYVSIVVISPDRVGPSRRSLAYVIVLENDILVSNSFLEMI